MHLRKSLLPSNLMMDSVTKVSEEDFLTEDQPISGQKYVCLSFLSPEDVLVNKQSFFFEYFMAEVVHTRVHDFTSAVESEPEKATEFSVALRTLMSNVDDDFKAFSKVNETRLEEEFAQQHPFKTTMCGLKVRGCFATEEAARSRASVLQRQDKTSNIFVAPVGVWLPWNPSPDCIGDSVYAEDTLNSLMKKKAHVSEAKDAVFTETTKKRIELAATEGMSSSIE